MLTANPTEGDALLEVSFDGSLSYARATRSYLEEYLWDFDGDGDGSDASMIYSTNPTPPTNYIRAMSSSGTDCCDTDANAKPGQTSWFTTTNDCGVYDYNCNGQVDLWLPDGGGSRLSCVGDECGDMGLWNLAVPDCGESKYFLEEFCISGKCAVITLTQMCH